MTVSLILSTPNAQFVEMEVRNRHLTKTRIINQALDMYRKYMLQKDMVEYFENQTDEDVAEAMSDFDDYLRIVDAKEE